MYTFSQSQWYSVNAKDQNINGIFGSHNQLNTKIRIGDKNFDTFNYLTQSTYFSKYLVAKLSLVGER